MFRSIKSVIVILFGISLIVSCQSPKETIVDVAPTTEVTKPDSALKVTQCEDPRSQMCTREYRPVCATRDTGVRCVTTPCPSTEQVTKSNACTACADEKVFSYVAGACN